MQQRAQFQRVVPNAVILREHHPVAHADIGQPLLVSRVLPQVVVVDFYACAAGAKRLGDGLSPEGVVNEENKIIKRP